MTFISWLLSLGGLVLCSIGAYFLGRGKRLKKLEANLSSSRIRLRDAEEHLRLHSLEQDLSRDMEVSGETETDLAVDEAGFRQDAGSETRVVRVDVQAVMAEAMAVEKGNDTQGEERVLYAEEPVLPHSDMTRRISLHSADEMLSLSNQVDLLTEDLGKVHRDYREEKKTRESAEQEAKQRLRRIAVLENLIEKQRKELVRRDERIKRLLSEVGLTLSGSDEVNETLDALASIDKTRKTRKIDLADLENMDDATIVDTMDVNKELSSVTSKGFAPSAPNAPCPNQEASFQGSKTPKAKRGSGLPTPPPPLFKREKS